MLRQRRAEEAGVRDTDEEKLHVRGYTPIYALRRTEAGCVQAKHSWSWRFVRGCMWTCSCGMIGLLLLAAFVVVRFGG